MGLLKGWFFGDLIPRRLLVITIVVVLVLLASAPIALACEITTTPEISSAQVGDQQNITVQVKLTHKNCTVPIDQTSIIATGMKIVSETQWKLSASTYTKRLTIVFTEPGKATLRVTRSCSRGGDTEETAFTVTPATAAPSHEKSAPVPAKDDVAADPTAEESSDPTPIPISLIPPVGGAKTDGPVGPFAARPVSDKNGNDRALESTGAPVSEVFLSDRTGAGAETTPTATTAAGGNPVWLALLGDPKVLAIVALLIVATALYKRGYHRFRQLVMVFSLAYLGFVLGGCLCPLGAVQYLALPEVLSSQKLVLVLLMGIPVLAALLMGRIFCGWICPAGALQELVHYSKTSVIVPAAWDRWLRWLKYLVFVTLITAVRITGEAIFKDIDPFKAAFNIGGSTVAVAGLAAILIASVFVYRPWCRYLCPIAAVFSVASRMGISHILAKPTCVGCKLCVKACGVQAIRMSANGGVEIDAGECLACGACQDACRRSALGQSMQKPWGTVRAGQAIPGSVPGIQ